MKKIISSVLAMTMCASMCINGLQTKTAQAVYIYENITKQVLQIKSYMDNKMYLEAIKLCEQTKYNHYLSQEDKNLLDQYRNNAKTAYNAYIENERKTKTKQYYISDWCMGYKFFSAYEPEFDEYNYDCVDLYVGENEWIDIESFRAGTYYDYPFYTTIKSPSQFVSLQARFIKENYGYDDFEVLSENNTMVGELPARQVTLRYSYDLNRYGTVKDYSIYRYTAFQFGDWIYVITAYRNDHSWGEDFWNKMELIRKSIGFY